MDARPRRPCHPTQGSRASGTDRPPDDPSRRAEGWRLAPLRGMCWAVVGDDGQMVDPNLRGVNNPVLTAGKKKKRKSSWKEKSPSRTLSVCRDLDGRVCSAVARDPPLLELPPPGPRFLAAKSTWPPIPTTTPREVGHQARTGRPVTRSPTGRRVRAWRLASLRVVCWAWRSWDNGGPKN